MKKQMNNNGLYIVFTISVFAFLLLFFTLINPLCIFDSDDWLYIYDNRIPVPSIHEWNPTRVFPEFFMPLVSYGGALVLRPLFNISYYFSLTLAHGIFCSLIITTYIISFCIMMFKKQYASKKTSVLLGVLFLVLHFIFYIKCGQDNKFLLHSNNVTCMYFYVLPTVLNFIIVMHFMCYDGIVEFTKKANLIHKLFIVGVIYFAINSNLYSSIVLSAYVCANLLLCFKEQILNKKEKSILVFIKEHYFEVGIICVWLCSHVFEFVGGRAHSLGGNFFLGLPVSIGFFVYAVIRTNIFVLIFLGFIFFIWIKKYKAGTFKFDNSKYYSVLISILITTIYLILLSAKVQYAYMARADVVIAIMIWILIAGVYCFNQLITENINYKKFVYILCGTLWLLTINSSTNILENYNFNNLSYKESKAVTDDIIKQFKDTEKNNKTEIDLVLPDFGVEGNWPMSEAFANRYGEALYRHKVIDSHITIKNITLSQEKTKELIGDKVKDSFTL